MRNLCAALVVVLSSFVPADAGLTPCGGTVTVSVKSNGSTIEVLGDDEANCIAAVLETNLLVVTGGETTVSGPPVPLAGVTTVSFLLKGGDDSLFLSQFPIAPPDLSNTDLKINLGAGSDEIAIKDATCRRLLLNAGAGDDTVDLGDVAVLVKSPINGSKGVDRYILSESFFSSKTEADGPIDTKGFEEIVASGSFSPF